MNQSNHNSSHAIAFRMLLRQQNMFIAYISTTEFRFNYTHIPSIQCRKLYAMNAAIADLGG
jgi:hypothetical protein